MIEIDKLKLLLLN